MAERSLQHRPFELSHTRARQASTSSSEASSATDGKSTSSVPRRRRASPALGVHQPSVAATGEPSRRRGTKQASTAPRDRSSKGPSTSMTAPVDAAGEVSYTPTTHRISKAKKGKKVHVCEYPGCGKVCQSSSSLSELLTVYLGVYSSRTPQVGQTYTPLILVFIDGDP